MLLNLRGNLRRYRCKVDFRFCLLLWQIALQIAFEAKAKNAINVQQQVYFDRRFQFIRAQHFPYKCHGARHIQIVLDL